VNRTERFYRIDQMLHERRVVPIETFLDELAISRATFKRDVEYLRERLHAPIVWDREAGGYRFDRLGEGAAAHALPGLWFSAGELYALLAAHQLLGALEPGVLASHVAPLRSRLEALLEGSGHPAAEIAQRVRLLAMGRRAVPVRFFTDIAIALLERRRIEIDAWSRARDEVATRTVSPQRLVHYRDNWYLDAWCHLRKGLRSFSVDTIQRVRMLPHKARELPAARLDAHYASAYGIFGGRATHWASLRFSPERARWVRSEQWHPGQQAEALPDGGLRLRVPYADPRELVMDILRHGRHVEVEAPTALRRALADETRALWAIYDKA